MPTSRATTWLGCIFIISLSIKCHRLVWDEHSGACTQEEEMRGLATCSGVGELSCTLCAALRLLSNWPLMPEVTREVESATSDSVDTPPTFRERDFSRKRKKKGGWWCGGSHTAIRRAWISGLKQSSWRTKPLRRNDVNPDEKNTSQMRHAASIEVRKAQAARRHEGLPESELASASAGVDQGLEEFSIQLQTCAFFVHSSDSTFDVCVCPKSGFWGHSAIWERKRGKKNQQQ